MTRLVYAGYHSGHDRTSKVETPTDRRSWGPDVGENSGLERECWLPQVRGERREASQQGPVLCLTESQRTPTAALHLATTLCQALYLQYLQPSGLICTLQLRKWRLREITQLIDDTAPNQTVTLAPKPASFPLSHAAPEDGVSGENYV